MNLSSGNSAQLLEVQQLASQLDAKTVDTGVVTNTSSLPRTGTAHDQLHSGYNPLRCLRFLLFISGGQAMFRNLSTIGLLFAALCASSLAQENWTPMINGKDL